MSPSPAPPFGFMLCYGLLNILNDFVFEPVFCKQQISHVTTEHGHEQHGHIRLQFPRVRAHHRCNEWLNSWPGLLPCMYLGQSWVLCVPKKASRVRTQAQIGSGNDDSKSLSSSSGGNGSPERGEEHCLGSMPALCWEASFLSIPGTYPYAFAQI